MAPRKCCPTCGKAYPEGVLFCPEDGAPLAPPAVAAGEDDYLGRTIAGQFRLTRLVGVGAMARVYRAHQVGLDRDAAVKILHRELSADATVRARFLREGRVAARLSHPNIVQVLMAESSNAERDRAESFLVMEYLEGMSLASLLAASGPLPLDSALHIVLQICDAMGEAHAFGVVHRDLKPENVMIVRRGLDRSFVKVLDFGVARAEWIADDAATRAGSVLGTARYVSPEGAMGATVGPAGDVYAIATILYECLAGHTPFQAESPVGILIHQAKTRPPSLKDSPAGARVPDVFDSIITRNLDKDPARRCSNARQLGHSLLEAAARCGLASAGARTTLLSRVDNDIAAGRATTRSYDVSDETRARMGRIEESSPGGTGLIARSLRRLLPLGLLLTMSSLARAQGTDRMTLRPDRDDTKETFGMAEFGVGLLTLPSAEVCVERRDAGCSKGDRSLTLSAWPLFRKESFAVGAGVSLALTPSTDAPLNNPEGLPRDHSRSYFTVEITGRYYVPFTEKLDGWAGITSGLVVVNDTFQTQRGLTELALVGPRGVTILTEGGTLGVAAGLALTIAESWLFGGSARVSNWFLPEDPAVDPIGDEASLTGNVMTIDLGLSLAYRSRFIF